MEKKFLKKSEYLYKLLLLLAIFFSSQTAVSQVDEEESEQVRDTVGYNSGKIDLGNPPSIVELYTYDPKTDRYVYTNTVGGFDVTLPLVLTPKEYEDRVLKESMKKYFQEKGKALEDRPGSEDEKKNLLPTYYVNSSFFETIFGSNTIDVKPTGSVEMDMGVRFTRQDNPAFSPRNRQAIAFDFQQRISMALNGKVGTRLNVNANYDTQSTFAFQNLIKLEYTPTEDDILQKIEVGNVNLPLNTSLIKGAQSLFGVKAQFQFGRTTVTGVFSEQKSQTRQVTAQGGGTLQDFDLFALDYDNDRHFFLSQYFRNRYDAAMRNYPVLDTRIQITRIEVWVTNRQNRVSSTENNLRNIVALQDLGEAQLSGLQDNEVVYLDPLPSGFFTAAPNTPPDNNNNRFDPALIGSGGYLTDAIREISTTSPNQAFNIPGVVVAEGQDYAKLENARKLTSNEYTFHPQLGYISLQQRLNNDEVLAVAYEFTSGGEVFQVGEFANGGVESTVVDGQNPETQVVSTQSLVLKMLKSNLTNVENELQNGQRLTAPVWNLMMKNIYQIAPGGQLEQEDFRFNILYSDPSPLNYITAAGTLPLPDDVERTPLLKVFNIDRLNVTNDPQVGGDGFFDFIPGLTVDTQNGRIIFTTVEPFGEFLFKKLATTTGTENYNDPATYNSNQAKYVFRTMYRSTQARALQDSDKNKYELRGRYKSTTGDGIAIGAYNVPRGSVVVTAGGRVLQEGIDYSVNYQLGRVQILDPSLAAANTPIQISVENNSVFGQQTRRFMGINVEHKFSDKFLVGATFLKMTERPFTQKSNYGQESVNNSIYGANVNYATEVPFLTRLVNKLPNMDTDAPSNISFRGEFAYLKPDTPKADQFEGEATLYVDDFEGSQTTIDMKGPLAWSLSSVPQDSTDPNNPFNFNGELSDNLEYGYKRAKLSWYTIDPIFFTSQRPGGLTDADLSLNKTRRVYIDEVFPEVDVADGQQTVINTLDLTYYPNERGPYNYNPSANGSNTLPNPEQNFGGITRAITSTNFEQSNVEYIQFWIMDPYYRGSGAPADFDSENPLNTGKLFFNLGEISEDVLRDGRKQYENGLPESGNTQNTITSSWGRIPASQSLIYAFDTNEANRAVQDVGYDGLEDKDENVRFPGFAATGDASADNYQFYLSAEGDVLERYKNYNGLDGNSPVSVSDNNRGNTTIPDVEDINRDNTMNTIDAYFQYAVDIRPNMPVGEGYITDERITVGRIPQGSQSGTIPVRWIQLKIPIDQGANTVKVGPIEDFRAIRFMRMFLTGFSEDITIRFATLDLVRGEWRRYTATLDPLDDNPDNDQTNFDVQAVNVQENGDKKPINYVTPPGVSREQLFNNNTVVRQNEQSLALRVYGNGLEENDSRAVFKNVSVDMRQFNKLKMFLHAEALPIESPDYKPLPDRKMIGFIRFGNDFTQNYYQVELPLKVSVPENPNGNLAAELVWPQENEVDLNLSLLTKLKVLALQNPSGAVDGVYSLNESELDPSLAGKVNEMRISVKGNPNFGLVRTLMVGVKNNPEVVAVSGNEIVGEVWFNELRLAEMDNQGGMAAVASLDGNLADFATISATGRMSTIGFGSLEDGPNERSREDIRQYNIVTNINVGKLLPKKWGVNIPFNYGVGEEIITPEYDPFNQDIKLDQLIDATADQAERDNIRERAIEYTKTKSINFIGVKKERAPEQKQRIYDVENLTLGYSFNETKRHDYEIEDYLDQQVRTTADYSYTFQSKPVEPFKKTKFMSKSSYWKLLSDFNFNYLPTNINFSSTVLRQYNRQQFRQVDVQGIGLDPLFRRNFLFNYQYGFNYNITKNLKVNYQASNSNLVQNFLQADGTPIENFSIWQDFLNVGEANTHNRQLTVNYELPLSKLPFLSFLKSSYTYTGDYQWQRASEALQAFTDVNGLTYNLGNTIQNNSAHRLNTTLNMDLFYRYIGLTGKKTKQPNKPAAAPKPGEKVVAQKAAVQNERGVFMTGLIGVLTSVKNVQVNYTETAGTILPGYLPGLGFFGSSKPSLGFVFGSQADVRYEAAKNGWLTNYPDFNGNYSQVLSKTIDATANIDLFPDFKIDLVANRTYVNNQSEQFDVSDGNYNPRAPYEFGNFSISTNLIRTAFSKSDETTSAAFDDFRENRLLVAQRLAAQRGLDPTDIDADGFPNGYGKNSQQVLLPAFMAAYVGQDARDVSLSPFRDFPIPNWNIKYSGLMRYKFFKDRFKRFSLQHGYRASYTINAFRSNFEFDNNPNGLDAGGNFFSRTIISNINLVEQFNPLIKIDMEMQNSMKVTAELKKDRALSLSFDNNLLTEVQGMEYIIGLGYRIKDVIFNSALADNPTGVIKSDINLRADFTLRNNKTIVRYLDYDNNQLGGGQNLWNLKLTADYSFSKNFTAIFFYDHSFSKAVISTAFPITNIRSGFTLRYNFGN